MEQLQIRNLTVGEIVANDFRTSSVFKKAGIDFCCGGKQKVIEACTQKGIDVSQLENEIIKLGDEQVNEFMNFKKWDPVFLSEYIVNTHGYKIPDDACNTYRVAFKMLEQFEDDLHTHVHLENNILFPKALELAN